MLRFGWTTIKKLTRFLKIQMKKQIQSPIYLNKNEYNNKILESYYTIIFEETRNKKIFNFYIFFCELLLNWNKFEGSLPLTQPNIALYYIPEYILKDLAGFIIYLTYYDHFSIFTVHVDGPIDKLLTFTTVLISSRDLFPNLKVINKFVRIFIILFKKKVLLDYSDIFKTNQTARKYLLVSLLIYYSQVEKYHFYGVSRSKLEFRKNICTLLKNLSRVQFFTNQFKKLQHSEEFSKFLNYLFDEITTCFDEGLNYIKKYKDFQDKNKVQNEYIDQLNEAKSLTSFFWTHINKSLSVILMFSRMKLEIMISEIFGKRLAAFINNFLKTFNGPNFHKIKIDDPASVNFKPKKTLERILEIYVSFIDNQDFINHIIGDSRSFDIKIFEKTFKILSKKLMVSTVLHDQFLKLIKKLQMSSSKRLVLIENAPKNFFCGLSEEIMTHPVELPSGVIIDRSSLDRHLLTSNFDPYTKVELSENNIKELPELRRSIQDYLNQ
jgi:ubiquitin conjugation factor E4 B